MVYKLFDKKSSGSGVATEPNYELVNKLHRQFIRNFKKRNVYSSFRYNTLGIDLADNQLMSKYNKGIKYLYKYLCVQLIFLVNMYELFFERQKRNQYR